MFNTLRSLPLYSKLAESLDSKWSVPMTDAIILGKMLQMIHEAQLAVNADEPEGADT